MSRAMQGGRFFRLQRALCGTGWSCLSTQARWAVPEPYMSCLWLRGGHVPFAAGSLTVCTVLVRGRAKAAAFLPQKPLGASFHSSCSKIIDSNVVSLGNLPRSCAQGPSGSEATEGCSQPHAVCRFQAQPHDQEWQGGTIIALPKWDSSPNPTPPSLPWLQPPPTGSKVAHARWPGEV